MTAGRRLAWAVLAAAVAFPAAALEAPKDYAGQWTISGVSEGAEVCTVTLGDEGAIGGWVLDVPKDCFEKFGFSEDVAAWTVYPDGAIGFINPLRKMLLRFEPAPIGGYVAEPDEGQPLALDRAGQSDRELTERERMSGRWALMSMGQVVCAWQSKPAADGMKGKLTPSKPCQPAWAKKKIVAWERAGGRLMLIDVRGRMVRALPGDGVEGFFSPPEAGENLGFVRDRD